MDRFMIHLKNPGYRPKDAQELLEKARYLSSKMSIIVRDARVAHKFLEFDVSIKKESLDELIEKLKPIAELDHVKPVVEEKIEKDEAIKNGIYYFNNERYWECHEILESVWKNCYEGEKDLVQGIILVAAALVHNQKNEDHICISILERALKKLANSSGIYNNIDVDKLRKNVEQIKNSKQIVRFSI